MQQTLEKAKLAINMETIKPAVLLHSNDMRTLGVFNIHSAMLCT